VRQHTQPDAACAADRSGAAPCCPMACGRRCHRRQMSTALDSSALDSLAGPYPNPALGRKLCPAALIGLHLTVRLKALSELRLGYQGGQVGAVKRFRVQLHVCLLL
jgi:hypothetical protein